MLVTIIFSGKKYLLKLAQHNPSPKTHKSNLIRQNIVRSWRLSSRSWPKASADKGLHFQQLRLLNYPFFPIYFLSCFNSSVVTSRLKYNISFGALKPYSLISTHVLYSIVFSSLLSNSLSSLNMLNLSYLKNNCRLPIPSR